MVLLFGLLWFLNLGISWWNARAVGHSWVETKQAGGWYRFLAWTGAVMSASGFTWCYLIGAVLVFAAMGKLGPAEVEAALSLGYLVIIFGVLFSGAAITLESWKRAYHERTLGNMGVAGYNSFAQVYNTYNAVRGVPQAFKAVMGFFKSSGKKDAKLMVVLLVVMAALSGVITTWMLIEHYAAAGEALPMRERRQQG